MTVAGNATRTRTGLAVIGVLVVIAVASAGFGRVFWPELASRLDAIRFWASANPVPALLLYLLAFAGMTLLCLPVGPASAVLGGVLFGAVGGAAAAIAAAIAGGAALFLVARRVAGPWLAERYPALLARLRREGFLAILALRVAPVVPGWLISVAAGSAGTGLLTFVVASAIGIVPAFLLFARLGAGMGVRLLDGEPPSVDVLLRPSELLPLLGLAALLAVPILLRAWRGRER